MKLLNLMERPPGRNLIRNVLLPILLIGCGQTGSESRLQNAPKTQSSEASNEAPTMSVEDVVQGFEVADKLPVQTASAEDQAAWEQSLVPEEMIRPADAEIASAEFQLDDASADQREIVDLRPNDTPVRNQGSEGTCTAFATIGTMENLIKRIYGKDVDISERHHWTTYADYQTTSSLKRASSAAIVSESSWPYKGSRPRDLTGLGVAKLKKYSTTKLSLQPIVDSLRKGQPVVIAVGVLTSLMNPKQGGIVQGGVQQGRTGHAIALTGAIIDSRVPGGGYFIIKNSWGSRWGDKGYGYVAFDYCQRTWCSAYSIADSALLASGVEVVRPETDSNTPSQPSDPRPAPVPQVPSQPQTPVVLTAEDFRLVAHPSNRRGFFGMTSFFLTIEAKPEIMKQIKSIQYAPDSGSYYTVTNGSSADIAVSSSNLASPDFRTRARSFHTEDVRIKLRDATVIKLQGIDVNL